MQKRKYVNGFYIEHIKVKRGDKIDVSQVNLDLQNNSSKKFQASLTNEFELDFKNETNASEIFSSSNCDTIILNNGVKMIVNVISIGDVNVIYKNCEGTNDDIQNIESTKVKSISYFDGNKITLNKNKNSSVDYDGNKLFKTKDDYKYKEAERGSKQLDNAIIALLIGLLFGPSMIVGFILAALAKNKLENKAGYEQRYKLARGISIVGLVLLIFTFLVIAFTLFILYGI